nr:MAG TPA: Nuclease [Caudoviricetes sp.]
MTKEKCILCGRETVSVIKTGTGYVCFNCYAESKVVPREKEEKKRNNNEEARMQMEFFNLVPLYFPNLPERVLFAVPNGGSRNKIEAANMKRQGVKRGVADVILLIPKKGFASLCLEFKTRVGKQSEEQKEFQKQAESCRNKYVVVRSASQAIEELRKYLS